MISITQKHKTGSTNDSRYAQQGTSTRSKGAACKKDNQSNNHNVHIDTTMKSRILR
jgi:hypothetical protein